MVRQSSSINAGDGLSMTIAGHEQLAILGKQLKAAGGGELRKELLRSIRDAVRPTIPKVHSHAADILPKRGGLAAQYAGNKIQVRTSLAASSASVRLVSRAPGRLRDVNNGNLRHPLFGNTEHWYPQKVKPGWFSQPISEDAPRVTLAVRRVMTRIAAKIDRSIR